ncbi:hypothetical protein LJR219_000833 [Phenylobacterium sp. LjRoot219]|uniref:hypothetical protein n=1 Tax=Phenylobacterium sp. LjRoot219 TaxID=3342283 RepID=UPI003ED0DC5C
MKKQHLKWLIPLAGLLALPGLAARAQSAVPQKPEASGPTVAGWDEFVDSLRTLPSRMLARLPEDQRNDPQVQQEIGRLALEALTSQAFDALAGDPDHPVFMPQIGQVLNVGQPNADTVYRTARVRPEGVYRLRGVRGALRLFNVSQSPPSPGEPGFRPEGAPRPRHELADVGVDAQGRFDVILSAERPKGYTGDWWKLEPTTTRLLVRMVSADWGKEQDPTLTIERLDVPASRSRPNAAELEQRLRRLPGAVNFIALLFVDHVEKLRQEGYVNKLKVFGISQTAGLLTGQSYYEGAYELRDDEALIIETPVPAKCGYRSLILTNDLYETTDWYNNHSSLNDAQAGVDKDGVLRIVVSAKDPGVANWLDTAGYPTGLIQGRWADCDATPTPTVRKVKLAELRKALPADTARVTPEQRDRIIRERRTALQERPLW